MAIRRRNLERIRRSVAGAKPSGSESVLFEPLNLIRAINEKARYRDGSNLLF